MNTTTTSHDDAQARKAAAQERGLRARRAVAERNRLQVDEILHLLNYAGCNARIEGAQEDARLIFTSQRTGTHSLALESTDAARAVAHWEGFTAGVNGGDWALVRPLRRDEEVDCMGESCHPTPLGDYAVCTDFGNFCSGACAEEERRARQDADDEAEADGRA